MTSVTFYSILSSTTDRLSAAPDSLEAENDHLRSLLHLQQAIAAQYEEDLSAKERYMELLSIKLKQAEKMAERSQREAEKDNVPLANVQDVLEDYGSCSAHTSNLLSNAEAAASETSHSNVDREVFLRQSQQLEAVIRERDQLLLELEAEKQNSQRLAASLSGADSQLTISASAFATAKETIKELQAKVWEHLRAREVVEEQATSMEQELEAQLADLREEADGLRSTQKSELDRLASAHRDAEEEFASREQSYRSQLDDLQAQLDESGVKRSAAEDRLKFLTSKVEGLKQNIEALEYEKEHAERQSFDSSEAQRRIETLEKEAERARRRIADLERGSGNKEIEITKLRKKLESLEEDRDGLNLALDLKQQELEMLKRKFRVRGTGGMTPFPSRAGLGRTLSVPDSTASIASSSIAEPVVESRAGPLLDTVNLHGRRSLSVSGMSAMKSTKHVRMAPRPSNPMELFKHPNASSNSVSHSNLEDSNVTEDMAATPRASTRDNKN
ncbi:hypothetical protein FRC00_003607 [Tulasnella sp. 408]|nr:hypothetical protein FRC00_003607 [Tulasnella sp. 408]